MNYYRIVWDPQAPTGLARGPRGMDLIEAMKQEALPLELEADDPVDYQPNFLVWRVCSERLRQVLDQHKGPADELRWIPIALFARKRRLQYFKLQSTPLPGLLHPDTIMAGAMIVKPVLDRDRAKLHQVFLLSEDGDTIVTRPVKDAIMAAGCTGIAFLKVLTAVSS